MKQFFFFKLTFLGSSSTVVLFALEVELLVKEVTVDVDLIDVDTLVAVIFFFRELI